MASADPGQRLSLDARLAVLDALVRDNPRDLICLDDGFRSCPPPETLREMGLPAEPAREVEVGEIRESLSERDNVALLRALRLARSEGIGSAQLDSADETGVPLRLSIIDLVDEHGVYVCVTGNVDRTDPAPEPTPAEARPRRVVQHRDGIAQFIWIDPATEAMLGHKPEEMLGRSALDYLHPDDQDRGIESWLDMLAGEVGGRHRVRWRTESGDWRWLEITHTNRLDDEGYVETEMLDVDDEMAALAQVRAGQQQFRALTESLPVGVARVDHDGELNFINEWLRRLIGVGVDATAGEVLTAVVTEDRDLLAEAVMAAIRGDGECDLTVRVHSRVPGGDRQCVVRVRPFEAEGDRRGAITSIEDVTESIDLQSRLRHQAETDHLTGLSNRAALVEHLDGLLRADPHATKGLAVLFFDLDDFKLVNDGLGHDAGDDLLSEIASRVAALVRPSDVVARVGGDEFVVVCPWARTIGDAAQIAERLIDEVQKTFRWSDRSASVSCSVGIALHDAHSAVTADELISNADLAMYKAKRAGGGRWEPYGDDLRETMTQMFELQRGIIDSLSSDELRLHVQPIRHLGSGATIGGECLLRWFRPGRGVADTAQLIETAEHSGLIVPLGRWVLDHVCAIAARAAALGHDDLRVSMNVSGRQLGHGSFADDLAGANDRHGISPEQLILEVTETVFVGTDGNVVDALRAIAATGCTVALDDFGTGYSSLNQLRLMPATMLKVDGTFTADLGHDTGTTAITQAMVKLSHDLGFELVAEGIETEQQRTVVRALGLELGQGFLLGRPVDPDAFFADLAAEQAGLGTHR